MKLGRYSSLASEAPAEPAPLQIPLATARAYAAKIVRALRPHCARIKVAGSVRRRRPIVHDLDIVILARDAAAIRKRCLEKCAPHREGDANFAVLSPLGFPIEIYFAEPPLRTLFGEIPSNFATLLLCRTGSKQHNVRFALAARCQGKHWHPYSGIIDERGQPVRCRTERELYAALGWDWIPPTRRE
jgi:DNA polymerase (family 10)